MPVPTDLINEFDDVDTTTDDDQNDNVNDVDDTSTDDDKTPEDEDAEDGKDTDTDDDDTTSDKDTDTTPANDDEGYFADDDDTSDDDTSPAELPAAPASFTPEEKYIVDNLPLIKVRVRLADDSIKTMEVRSAADLPRDMKGIATPYEDKQFDLANAAQETRARELQTYYRQHQTQLQAQEFEKKENQSIRDDIAELQRDGEIPKFKAQPGTRAFDNDPAAKTVQEVIEFMNDRNAKYLEQSNKGGAYRHIGFAEAYELMNAGGKNTSKNSSARKDAARKLVSKQGGSSAKTPKAPVSGRTLKDVAAEFDNFEV
jgi:hypothetical protein